MTDDQKGEHTRKRLKKMFSKIESKRKKKRGGKITYRMTGGQVVSNGYD